MKIRATRLSSLIQATVILFLLSSSSLLAAYGPFREDQELVASDLAPGDHFGVSFAIEDDLAIVGAHRSDHGRIDDAGAVYVFLRANRTFRQLTKLTGPTPRPNALFGMSVDIDGRTMVVGAPGDGGTGAAYVFAWEGGGVRLQARLAASDGARGDRFGRTVLISGSTILVNARNNDHSGARDAGAAYVFEREHDRWFEQQKLMPDTARVEGRFGTAAVLAGDTALISSSSARTGDGSVYQFLRQGGRWQQIQRLDAFGTGRADEFGASLALHEKTLIATAPSVDRSGMLNTGAAFVFERRSASGPFELTAKVEASEPWDEAWFGSGAALADDMAVVSASSLRSRRPGVANVYRRDGTQWFEAQSLIGNDVAVGDRFGENVALDGDTLLVGGLAHDHGGVEDCGAVYVFGRQPTMDAVADPTCRDDTAAPIISCNAPRSISPAYLPVTITASAVDDCGGTRVRVTDYACPASNGIGPGTDRCQVSMRGEHLTIRHLADAEYAVVWRVEAFDSAGNGIAMRCRVQVAGR